MMVNGDVPSLSPPSAPEASQSFKLACHARLLSKTGTEAPRSKKHVLDQDRLWR